MNKLLGCTYIALLTLALLLPLASIKVVNATITGRPVIWFFNGTTDVFADPLEVPAVLATGQRLAIDFSEMTISGALVWIWFSTDGSALIVPGDAVYIGGIYIHDIYGDTPKTFELDVLDVFRTAIAKVSVTVGLGWVNVTQLPGMFIGSKYYWIKVTDVNPAIGTAIPSSDVGVSTNRLVFKPSYRYETANNLAFLDGLGVIPNEPITVIGSTVPIENHTIFIQYDTKSINLSTYPPIIERIATQYAGGTWNWSRLSVRVLTPDLGLASPDGPVKMSLNVSSPTIGNLTLTPALYELPRRAVFNARPVDHRGDYSGMIVCDTGAQYPVFIGNFTYRGWAVTAIENVTLRYYRVLANVTLGAFGNATYYVRIPTDVPFTGRYNITITDDNGFKYWFTIFVRIAPYIDISPKEGFVGDSVRIYGYFFNDYVNKTINIWFQVNATTALLVKEYNVTTVNWTLTIVVPNATCGPKSIIVTTDIGSEGEYRDRDFVYGSRISDATVAEFVVKPKLVVVPSVVKPDGRTIALIGTGFCSFVDVGEVYSVIVDNQYMTNVIADGVGRLYVELVAAGLAPGLHSVALYPRDPVYFYYTSVSSRTPAFTALFTVLGNTTDDLALLLMQLGSQVSGLQLTADRIVYLITLLRSDVGSVGDKVDALSIQLTSVNASLASLVIAKGSEVIGVVNVRTSELLSALSTLGTNMTLQFTGLSGQLSSVNASLAQLVIAKGSEVVATIGVKLDALNATIVSVARDVAYVKTVVGTLSVNLTDLRSAQAEIKDLVVSSTGEVKALITTSAGNITASVSAVKALVQAGLPVDTGTLLSRIDALRTNVGDKLDGLAATLSGVDSKVNDIKSLSTDAKSLATDIKNALPNIATKTDVGGVKSSVESASKEVKDAVAGVSSSVTMFGAVNAVLIVIAVALLAFSIFKKKA
ncbi:MAG: hypothetical protein N3E36_05875 [Sulfolobales archaeon]|nr:hypothetical protein [Sulfolobales archaeon]